jgi:Membrane protein involved in the export of O-antigen and teichoic acid
VQGSLIQRGNRIRLIAIANALGTSTGCLSAAGLALTGIGIWSIVFSYLLGQCVWLVIYLKCESWRPRRGFTLSHAKELLLFSKNVLGVELLDKLRANLDYLIIGRVLGTEALGLYYFAFNSGLGISLSVISHFTYAVFPHLCSARGDLQVLKQKYMDSVKSAALIVIPIVLLQSALAPIYVPIVFSEKWISAIPILILICLSAIPRPFALISSQLLIASDKGHLDLYWNFIFTSLFTFFLFIIVPFGVIPTAGYVLVVHWILLPAFSVWVYRRIFHTV